MRTLMLTSATLAASLLASGAALAGGSEIGTCPGAFHYGSGDGPDVNGNGWTMAQAGPAKPTTDFYHASGNAPDPHANGWTMAQAGPAKPTTDFYHASGRCTLVTDIGSASRAPVFVTGPGPEEPRSVASVPDRQQ